MNNLITDLILYLFPKPDMETKREINAQNIKNLYYLSATVGIVQLVSLVVFLCTHIDSFDGETNGAIVRVGSSVVLCLFGFIISRMLKNNPNAAEKHPFASRAFIYIFVVSIIIWSMFVSVNNYINHQQLLTFYTVELLAVLFVRLNPVFTGIMILSSYLINYLILNFCITPGLINPYNYAMLAVLSAIGAIVNYRLMINYISEKNKANVLNESLEIIANYDSITRLQNRYALNQCVPDYLNRDICIAIGDINSFKAVNDTYGHQTGDDVLKLFADILQDFFPRKCLFRYGGDEFLIIVWGGDRDALLEKLDRINKAFGEVKISGVEKGFSCSFGCVSAHPKTTLELFTALTEADKMMYEKKRNPRQ